MLIHGPKYDKLDLISVVIPRVTFITAMYRVMLTLVKRNNAWDSLCEFSTTTSNVYIDVVIFVILSCTMHCCFGEKIICTESFDYRINNLFGYSTYSFHLICCFSKFLKTIVLLRLWSFWNKCHNFSLKEWVKNFTVLFLNDTRSFQEVIRSIT